MMTGLHYHKLALVIALAAMNSALARGQSQPGALARLQSSDHSERRSGFYSLLSSVDSSGSSLSYRARNERLAAFARQQPAVGRGLIGLLERENAEPAAQVSEDRYIGDLIAAVAALRDPNAVHALAGAINTGRLATEGLAILGDAAVPAVLTEAERLDYPTRVSALLTLSEMVTITPAPTISNENRGQIRSILLRALDDSNRFAREAGLDGLVAFPDTVVRRAVARVAAQDPLVLHDGGKLRYPVRERALTTLGKLDALWPRARS
jgi:hypothetical protein